MNTQTFTLKKLYLALPILLLFFSCKKDDSVIIKYEIIGAGGTNGYDVSFTNEWSQTSWAFATSNWSYEIIAKKNKDNCHQLVLIPRLPVGSGATISGTVNIFIDGHLVATKHVQDFGNEYKVKNENGVIVPGIETRICQY